MKVGYVAPMSIAAVNGGVRTQAHFTITHIKKMGVEPILLSPWDDLTGRSLDLVHVFGASVENSEIIPKIQDLNIPVLLSPVFYTNHSASRIRKVIQAEKFLSKFGSGIRTDFGIKSALCHKANLLLPNTSDEANLILEGFEVPKPKIEIIPNGVEERFGDATRDAFVEKYGIEDFILFAGQASAPRKNVIQILKIASKLEAPVVIIGDFGKDNYSKDCLSLANKAQNVTLIPTLPHSSELLSSAYAASSVFVLPSFYETPGIAALEAALAGSNIVITEHGGPKDYFEDYAEYIDPNSKRSLLNAIKKALQKPTSDLKEMILHKFTWDNVAQKTKSQYQRLLN
jgi:glycosyltransferase involved in cell wall biosynthesis